MFAEDFQSFIVYLFWYLWISICLNWRFFSHIYTYCRLGKTTRIQSNWYSKNRGEMKCKLDEDSNQFVILDKPWWVSLSICWASFEFEWSYGETVASRTWYVDFLSEFWRVYISFVDRDRVTSLEENATEQYRSIFDLIQKYLNMFSQNSMRSISVCL